LSGRIKRRRGLRSYFSSLGPGVITGAADNDPSGIVTYLVAGAASGFKILWLSIFTLPMLIVIEEMSARVGVVTKKGLARVLRETYGVRFAIAAAVIVAICNIATIGADIGGASSCIELLTGIRMEYSVVVFGLILMFILLFRGYHYLSRLLFVLTPFLLLYVVNGFLAKPELREVAINTFKPSVDFSLNYLVAVVAVLGTTLSPYLIFWQTTEEVEEGKTVNQLKQESFDVLLGMVYSVVIFYFIILSGAAVFHKQSISVADVRTAALSLKPLLGNAAFLTFSLGIIFSSLIAVPVLVGSTAYVLSEAFGLPEGLNKRLREAPFFYITIVGSIILAILINLLKIDPVRFLYYSQVLNGYLMPFLIYMLVKVTSNREVMGENISKKTSLIIAYLTGIIFVLCDLFLAYELLKQAL
jgi:Mn2+/Fe2+ NRAMP family transporter